MDPGSVKGPLSGWTTSTATSTGRPRETSADAKSKRSSDNHPRPTSWLISNRKALWMRIGAGKPPKNHHQPEELETYLDGRSGGHAVVRSGRRYVQPGKAINIVIRLDQDDGNAQL